MMNNWFECGIRYDKVQENGLMKKVTELYLVPAISFTEAEAKITQEISPYMSGEYYITTIRRANYSEIFPSVEENDESWFKCKVYFITLNEKTGTEKKTGCYMLVQAKSTEDASRYLNEQISGTASDYQIASVSETNIFNVFN